MKPAALFLAVMTVAGGASAVAAVPAATTPGGDLVITVRSIQTANVPSDKPPAGPSKGDRFLIRDDLLNVAGQFGKQAGAVVGTDVGTLTMSSKTAGTVVGYAKLPGGRVRFHGILHFTGANAPFKVDGGTGKYANVQGFLIIGAGSRPLNIYHLRLPSAGTTV
ncbi:MAG: hypothetical protein QOE87_2588 [Gaiellales bacterium]|nr:hypothetical protein [Gaiellales bacterium]